MFAMSTGPRKPPPPRPRRDDSTVKDGVLTSVLNQRVRREVELEKAADETELLEPLQPLQEETSEARVVIVLGPDGVPQIADEVDAAPPTVRMDLDESPAPREPPPKR